MKIVLQNRDQRAVCKSKIDANGVFSSLVSYPDRRTAPRNLSEQISKSYKLHYESMRCGIGDVDMIFDKCEMESVCFLKRADFYGYPGPDNFRREPIEDAETIIQNLFMIPDLGDQSDGLYLEKAESPRVRHDVLDRRVSVIMSRCLDGRRLTWVADTLAVVTDSTMTLRGFEFFDVGVIG